MFGLDLLTVEIPFLNFWGVAQNFKKRGARPLAGGYNDDTKKLGEKK